MNILITGGAGYIGTELVFALDKLPAVTTIVVYDNLSRGNYNLFIGKDKLSQKVKFINGDILDSRNLNKHVKDAQIVFHLAAKVTTPFSDQNAHAFEQINNWGTSEVVYAVENSDVQKYVYMSSVSVYGSGDTEIESVDYNIHPDTYYGITKKKGEEHVKRLFPKKDTYILRCGNVYGYSKSMRFEAVINKFMFEANFSNKISIQGSGEQTRAFIYIHSVIKALLDVVSDKIKPGTYNLVENNYSILDIVEALQSLYPDLEMIFMNQGFPMKTIKVKPENALFGIGNNTLLSELTAFKQNFIF